MTLVAQLKFIETNEGFGSGEHLLEDFVPLDSDNFIEPLNVWIEGVKQDWVEKYCCTVASKTLRPELKKLIGTGAYVGEPFWFENFDSDIIKSTIDDYIKKYPKTANFSGNDWLQPKLVHENLTFENNKINFDVH